MKRNELPFMPEYHDRYIMKTDDVDILDAIQMSIDELTPEFVSKLVALNEQVYEPGKWTIKDILQHLIDTARVFSYRMLAFSRLETQAMPIFPEDDYAKNAEANHRTVEDLVAELKLINASFKALYQSFTPEMLVRTGKGFMGVYSVASTGFMLPGHQRWHLEVVKEKYFPLLDK
jgi:hypothetical protein